MSHPVPAQNSPALEVNTPTNQTWRLHEQKPERFTMIVFYRGRHCPVCRKYLTELDQKLDQFSGRGVEVPAVGCDTRDGAEESRRG